MKQMPSQLLFLFPESIYLPIDIDKLYLYVYVYSKSKPNSRTKMNVSKLEKKPSKNKIKGKKS